MIAIEISLENRNFVARCKSVVMTITKKVLMGGPLISTFISCCDEDIRLNFKSTVLIHLSGHVGKEFYVNMSG